MSHTKQSFISLCFLFFLIGLASCSSRVQFDYRTSRQPEAVDRSWQGETSASLTTQAPDGSKADGEDGHLAQWATGLEAKFYIPVVNTSDQETVLPVAPNKIFSAELVSAEEKIIPVTRQEWKRTATLNKRKTLKGVNVLKKGVASPAKNPFNQGILAALLIFGLGTGIILLGSLLPPLGTILGWVVGVFVLLIGVAFLALTLAGFSVRIIG